MPIASGFHARPAGRRRSRIPSPTSLRLDWPHSRRTRFHGVKTAAPAFGEDGAVNLGADTLAALVDRCPFPAGLLDLNDWRYVDVNDGVAEMLGLDRRPVGADLRQFVQDPLRATARLRLLRDAG